MPTYEYQCRDCGHRFDEFQSMTAAPITECPECNGQTERLISGGAGFVFKGAGFYQTDYRSKEYKDAAAKDKPATSSDKKPEPSKAETKSESKSKPESKSDKK